MNALRKIKPVLNLRITLFFAVALCFGVSLYAKILFETLSASDFIFPCLFFTVAQFPLSVKRSICLLCCLVFGFGLGLGVAYLNGEDYFNQTSAGSVELCGEVTSHSVGNGYCIVELDGLSIAGVEVDGRCKITLGEEVRAGDLVKIKANLSPLTKEKIATNEYYFSFFSEDIRYTATAKEYEIVGKSSNLFLRLNTALYERLNEGMNAHEGSIAYALLTGNTGGVDSGLLSAIRYGGIAHMFAVSGLHIGILYAVVFTLCKPLKRFRFLPAVAVALCYSGLCGFTVSSLRAVVMCAMLGLQKASGRKYDFLSSISLAAIFTLLLMPLQWLSAGFQLSFGACVGLALFSGSFSRALGKKLPKLLANGLSSALAVQIFTFPIAFSYFGYLSLWGFLLNLICIPLMPVLFLGVIVCVIFALCLVPATGFFLALPQSMLSLLTYLFSLFDFSFSLTGFSLYGGAIVWLIASVFISQRVNMTIFCKGGTALSLCLCFILCVVTQNTVYEGCEIITYSQEGASALLIRTEEKNILVMEEDITVAQCEHFLSRHYAGELDGVIVLSSSQGKALNRAVFLDSKAVYAMEEVETGLRETKVIFGKHVDFGEITFTYERKEKLLLCVQNLVVEIDFSGNSAFSPHLFIGSECGNLKYFLRSGTIEVQ